MRKMRKREVVGFTIVELLIVIVVIAILAAISVVAYNGIQTRAENTKTTNSVASYAKALTLYSVDNNSYPSYTRPCLGQMSTCGNITDTTAPCNGIGRGGNIVAFNTTIETVAASLPSPSTQQVNCDGKVYAGALYTYVYSNGRAREAFIHFVLKGDVDCPEVGGTSFVERYQNSNTTLCQVGLPALP